MEARADMEIRNGKRGEEADRLLREALDKLEEKEKELDAVLDENEKLREEADGYFDKLNKLEHGGEEEMERLKKKIEGALGEKEDLEAEVRQSQELVGEKVDQVVSMWSIGSHIQQLPVARTCRAVGSIRGGIGLTMYVSFGARNPYNTTYKRKSSN